MNTLPKEAINKIMMFLSHPVADIIKQSDVTKNHIVRKRQIKINEYYKIPMLSDSMLRGFCEAMDKFDDDKYIYKPKMFIDSITDPYDDELVGERYMTSELIEAYYLGVSNYFYAREGMIYDGF